MVQEHTPQATFSPPLDSKQHEAVNIPIVPGLKEKHVKSPILSSFCLLGTLFTYVLMEK